ncbi:DUF5988 family protein [Streptantibioticus silvisoli]|uniref:DUF5988 family protein n=1 Tax=Streptantibioticus silvisoli TaxID=2705255 RepID=A0ABT6VV98_9ACTN|nr:DUF5988 family protein [Streptantibioticus silvisoli]MDI5962390.1 DUF5988 family protein [Streptantibioticus silvisoli]
MNPGVTHNFGHYRTTNPGELIDVVLTGGPADIPENLGVPKSMVEDGKVKIQRLGGYEHYERSGGIGTGETAGSPVFSWTTRTKIAE